MLFHRRRLLDAMRELGRKRRSLIVPAPLVMALLCRLDCDEIAHACRESGLNDTPAAQDVGARPYFLVAEAAAGSVLSCQRQLAGGKSSRTKSGCNHGYEQRGFESFSHDSSLI